MVRAIEANLEGGKLVLRVTKWYDFKKEDENFTLSSFARWWLGNALAGSTAAGGATWHWELYILEGQQLVFGIV